ncbi:dynein light chain Tctex-type 5 isoform X2 [Nelusetta ayraudi]|uniref:dynein light chain Tctex-type 5 isoform X2 n=1 Tax=Nelusetta ayraudi TaxID=303726 RepID=UPI003F6ECDE1
MSDQQKDKSQKKEKKTGKAPSEASGARGKETAGRTKDSISTVSGIEEQGQQDDKFGKQMENTYQLGPFKRIPVSAVTEILKDVLTTYLQEEKYEVEWSQKMTKTISELCDQSMQISSRCLWDSTNDTFATYSFKNSSLFGVGTVYAVYYE